MPFHQVRLPYSGGPAGPAVAISISIHAAAKAAGRAGPYAARAVSLRTY